jgi:hypothetical protein
MVAAHGGGQSWSMTDDLPLVRGAVAGAAAYVLGLVLTFLLLTIDSEVDVGEVGRGETSTLDVVGWFFYNAHFVDIDVKLQGFLGQSRNFISDTPLQLPEVVYHAVPIVLLITVGFLFVSALDLGNPSVTEVGIAGTTVAVGYLPLAVVGTFLFEASNGVASFAPPLLMSTLLLGLAFPVCFGAIGGLLSSQV